MQRTSDGGWVAVARYGQKPMIQNTGQQLENITVTGTWFQSNGMANLNALRALQNQRAPLVLADGYGNNLGQWTIKRLEEKQDRIIDDAIAFKLAKLTLGNGRDRFNLGKNKLTNSTDQTTQSANRASRSLDRLNRKLNNLGAGARQSPTTYGGERLSKEERKRRKKDYLQGRTTQRATPTRPSRLSGRFRLGKYGRLAGLLGSGAAADGGSLGEWIGGALQMNELAAGLKTTKPTNPHPKPSQSKANSYKTTTKASPSHQPST